MRKYENQVLSGGFPFASPTIDVFFPGSTTSATIYSDEGVTTKSNPFSGDAQGRFNFYAPDGDYDIRVSGTGLTTYTLADQSVADTKRVTSVGANERDTSVLVNAFYNRSAAAWHRRDTGFAAWRVDLDVAAGTDYIRFLRVAAGANPITWVELLRLTTTAAATTFETMGSEPNRDLVLLAKGSAYVRFGNASGTWGRFTGPASAIANFIELTAELTGVHPGVVARGTDTPNIGLDIFCKGTEVIVLGTLVASGEPAWMRVTGPDVPANYLRVTGGAAGARVAAEVDGTDANIDFALGPKGTTGNIQWLKALIALGGGATPTLGTIGGSGPATAAQNSWMQVKDSTGATFWVPVWK